MWLDAEVALTSSRAAAVVQRGCSFLSLVLSPLRRTSLLASH
jgi:hypothetical protein